MGIYEVMNQVLSQVFYQVTYHRFNLVPYQVIYQVQVRDQVLSQVQYQVIYHRFNLAPNPVICHQPYLAHYPMINQVIEKNRRKNQKRVKNKFKREKKSYGSSINQSIVVISSVWMPQYVEPTFSLRSYNCFRCFIKGKVVIY